MACRFAYWPGQFCSFVLDIDGKKVVRSYSISSTPTRPYSLEVTVKRVGSASNTVTVTTQCGPRVPVISVPPVAPSATTYPITWNGSQQRDANSCGDEPRR